MALGPNDPTWKKLYELLAKLATECGGSSAFVLDEGNGLWCVAMPEASAWSATPHEDKCADRFYRDVVAPRANELRKGKHVEVTKTDGNDRYAATSFASIYILVVWFDREFQPFAARSKIRSAVPAIEALVVKLPPSGGPGADEAAGKMRA